MKKVIFLTSALLQLGMAAGPQPKTMKVTIKESGEPAIINESDFDEELHEPAEGQSKPGEKKGRPNLGGKTNPKSTTAAGEEDKKDTSSSRK